MSHKYADESSKIILKNIKISKGTLIFCNLVFIRKQAISIRRPFQIQININLQKKYILNLKKNSYGQTTVL